MCMMIDQKQGTVQRFVPKQREMEWWVSTRSGSPKVCIFAREPSRFLKLWNCTDCGSQCTMMEEQAWQTVSQPGARRGACAHADLLPGRDESPRIDYLRLGAVSCLPLALAELG